MESRNPVFGRSQEFNRGGYATFDTRTPSAGELNDMYASPSATTRDTGRMTIDDVVIRTGALFTVLLATAAATWQLLPPVDAGGLGVVLIAALVGVGLSLWISFSHYQLATNTARPAGFSNYEALVEEVQRQGAALMTIKTASRRNWPEGAEQTHTTWYEPCTEDERIRAAVSWVLAHDEITGLATSGDVTLLGAIVAAERDRLAPADADTELERDPEYSSPFLHMTI